jgi:hypothetical protein
MVFKLSPDQVGNLFDVAQIAADVVYFNGTLWIPKSLSSINVMDPPQDLTIDAGSEDITPTVPIGLVAVIRLMGSGGPGAVDTLKQINVNAVAWSGKRILIMRQPTAGVITIEKNTAKIAASVNRTLDHDLDNAEYRTTPTNNLIAELSYSNNG